MLPSREAQLECVARPPRSSSKAFFASTNARDAFVLAEVWDVGCFRQLPRTSTASSQRFRGQKSSHEESPEAGRIDLALPALRKSGKELLETLPESPQNPIRSIPRGLRKRKRDRQGAKMCKDVQRFFVRKLQGASVAIQLLTSSSPHRRPAASPRTPIISKD